MPYLFHTTTADAAEAIMRDGFIGKVPQHPRYGGGTYTFDTFDTRTGRMIPAGTPRPALITKPGVWLSTVPMIDDDLLHATGLFDFDALKQRFIVLTVPQGTLASPAPYGIWNDDSWRAGAQLFEPAERVNGWPRELWPLEKCIRCDLSTRAPAERAYIFEQAQKRDYGREVCELILAQFSAVPA